MSVTFLTNEDKVELEQKIGELSAEKDELKGKLTETVSFNDMQELTDAQKAQARANIGAAPLDPDCHADYFQITEAGVVSLKPEYRGPSTRTSYPTAISDNGSGVAGSKNSDLPKCLVVPEVVGGVLVEALADGIFSTNRAIEYVVLPSGITRLPIYCFDQCWYLKAVYNTEGITSIGDSGLQATAIKKVSFPNLETLEGKNSFYCCGHLEYANIGKVNSIPKLAFERCSALRTVKNTGEIATVGERAFKNTSRLKKANFMESLTSIGQYAFYRSSIDYDWASLNGCTFGTNATPLQLNPADIWSACTFTPCENPLPTYLSQHNPLWADRAVGSSGETYSGACVLFDIIFIYCGIHDLSITSVEEFEEIVDSISPGILNSYIGYKDAAAQFMQSLGLNATHYAEYNQSTLQALYNALAAGGYASATVGTAAKTTGHTVTIYGVNDDGEFLVADCSSDTYDDRSIPVPLHTMHYKQFLAPSGYGRGGLVIVTP